MSCDHDVFRDQVLHSVSAESFTPRIREQELRWLSSLVFDPGIQHRRRWLCQRRASLLAPFSFTTDVSANTKEDILLSQTSYLGESQASLDSGQKDRVIASAAPAFLIGCAQEGFDFRSSEVIDQTPGQPFIGDCQHSLDEPGMLRCFQCRVMIKRTDRRQTGIPATCTVGSVRFQIVQKLDQKRRVELCQSELRRMNAQSLVRKSY